MGPGDLSRQTPAHGGVFLDHVGWFVADAREADAAFQRLGFSLTPLSAHRLEDPRDGTPSAAGTANRCAMLRAGYLECITAVAGVNTPLSRAHRAAVARHQGAHLIAFGVADAAAAHRRLTTAGFEPHAPVHLRRPMALADGSVVEAAFTVVRVPPASMPEGRIQFVVHETPEHTWGAWADEGANHLLELTSVLICTADPDEAARRFGRFLEREAVVREHRAWIHLDRGGLGFATPERCAHLLPGVPLPSPPAIVAVGLASHDQGRVRGYFAERGIRATFDSATQFCIGPQSASGTALVVHDASAPWLSALA